MKSLILSIFALSSLPCFSEIGEVARTCRIIFVDRPRNAPEEVQLFDGMASHKVPLSDMNFSDVVTLPPGDLELGMTPDPVAKPEDFPPGAPTVKIPAEVTDFFLIVVSDPENKILPVRMLPVDPGDKQPKTGQTLWINLTTHAITGTLGNVTLTLPPKGRLISKAPLPASGYFKAEFQYQPDGAGEFLPVMKKSWWFDATSRNLGFIIESGGRLPKIFTFRDQRTPESPESKE